jgi:hypothetical protein
MPTHDPLRGVLDDGIWAPRCDLHRRFDPGAETRAANNAADPVARKLRLPDRR